MEIILKDIKLFGYHGVTELERISGTEFVINLIISTDDTTANPIIQLKDTIDYSDVFSILKVEFAKTEELLEVLADRISTTIKNKFIIAKSVEITIMKMNAPIFGIEGQVGIKFVKT